MDSLFSIITVCYNSEKTISQTFESILSQTIKGFEYIVIDGNSTDTTLSIIKKYESKFAQAGIVFKWKSEPDNGIYDAMNKGISLASNPLIGIINSDDIYMKNTLEIVENNYLADSAFDVYHGIVHNINNNQTISYAGHSSSLLLKGGMIEHPTCFVKKMVYDKYGVFSLSYRYAADFDFMLRIKKQGARFKLIPQILAVFNENGSGNCRLSRKEAIVIKRKYRLISIVKMLELLLRNYLK